MISPAVSCGRSFLRRMGGRIAVNGREAVSAFREALEADQPYDLVCLDIMMPEKDGHQTLEKMRALEETRDIGSIQEAKIIMTTALGDLKNVAAAYDELCDGYLVNPIDKAKLMAPLEEWKVSPKESRR
jgi:two-component system, chemotaxis family, chemotaxis protein CheY